MLRLLAGPALAIFGVGDDDQTIYSYSGASPEWLVDFDDYVPMAEHHDLTVNYRCPVAGRQRSPNLLSRNQAPRAKDDRLPDRRTSRARRRCRSSACPIPVLATAELVREHLANGAQAVRDRGAHEGQHAACSGAGCT